MTYKDFEIKNSYISMGDEGIAKAFVSPLLNCTKLYRRSVGFFSSSVLEPIMDGIMSFVKNNGRIQLIASPQLSQEDVEAINSGYDLRKVIENSFTKTFNSEILKFDNNHLNLLSELIGKGYLDIKLAVTNSAGAYHDKLGILTDNAGNIVVFYGSANSSINGYQNNYEKIRVIKGWEASQYDRVLEEIKEFENLWNGTNQFVNVYDYSECASKELIRIIERGRSSDKKKIELRDYQNAAIAAWEENNYHGFYVMATGTGKTWTAIYSAKRLLEKEEAIIVICAPYKHLIKQWTEDLEKVFDNAIIILVSSENPNWEIQIREALIKKRYEKGLQIIIVSTIASFSSERFEKCFEGSSHDRLLIVDEAHRFPIYDIDIGTMYQYLLGLSATPFSGSSAQKGKELMQAFGGEVFSLTIEDALKRNYLVPYYYHPIFIHSTEEEESKFKYQTQRILSCFRNGVCIDHDGLIKALRNRLRIIAMASEKQTTIDSILSDIPTDNHFIVYCGDGKLFDNNTGEEIRHIQSIKRVLTKHGYRTSQFTASENMKERMELVDSFNKGLIDVLVAIRCLDEGINIPTIKSALILSSNDDYREFVQRRGRILRTAPGKQYAEIYDVVVLPNYDCQSWAKIEFRRFREYSKLALNYEECEDKLNALLNTYSLTMEDIDVYDYENMEEDLDE